jgi:hypothetical protein
MLEKVESKNCEGQFHDFPVDVTVVTRVSDKVPAEGIRAHWWSSSSHGGIYIWHSYISTYDTVT